MLRNEWETLKEIADRTGEDGEAVVMTVQAAYFNGLAECRCIDRHDGKVTEWRKKHA